LLKTVKELNSRLMTSEEEQSKLIQNLKAAVGTLPARHQRKFANLTGCVPLRRLIWQLLVVKYSEALSQPFAVRLLGFSGWNPQ